MFTGTMCTYLLSCLLVFPDLFFLKNCFFSFLRLAMAFAFFSSFFFLSFFWGVGAVGAVEGQLTSKL